MTTIQISRDLPMHMGYLFESVLDGLGISKAYSFTHSGFELRSASRKDVFVRYTPSKSVSAATGFRRAIESDDAELILWRNNPYRLAEDVLTTLDLLEGLYGDIMLTVVTVEGAMTPDEYREIKVK